MMLRIPAGRCPRICRAGLGVTIAMLAAVSGPAATPQNAAVAPATPGSPPAPLAAAGGMQVQQIAPDVFVATFSYCNSLFVIGKKAVLVVDTYNPAFAARLKAEIERRTPLPVRYVVYSHAHKDHLGGAALFAHAATIIAQRRQVEQLAFMDDPTVPAPDELFDREYRIDLGGIGARLHDFGRDHGTGVTVVELPDRRIVTAFDLAYRNRWRWYGLPDESPRRVLASLRRLQALEFDVAVAAHGPMLTPADVAAHADFLDDLIRQIEVVYDESIAAGLPPPVGIARALREVRTQRYSEWGMSENRELHIIAIYNSLLEGF